MSITRERLLEIIVTGPEASGAEQNELARMALAAMDSEPVAWTWHYREQWHVTNDEERVRDLAWDGVKVEPLYRHAQPVPEMKPVGYLFVSEQGAIAYSPTNWGMPGFRLIGQIYGDIDVESQPAPVVPDGYVMVPKEPTAEMQSAGASAIRIETTALNKLWTGNAVFRAMLAAAPQSPGSEPATVPGKWIPVCERVPTKQDGSVFLTWNGQYIGKELFLMGSFQCLKPEIITHWMPLPAAPQEVNHG
ncbi:DUF551 domain-containing protein [Klebsiella pneumoniae]|nr:DUF551 domain-containing protein [Klebsiella pneumoniae]